MSIQQVMGFDYGSKRIGVAIGQTITATATPLATVLVKNQQPEWISISTLIQEWQPDALIVGLPPLHADGSNNIITIAAQQFSQQLQVRYQLPIYFIDEALSSVAAAERRFALAPKERISKTRYLNKGNNNSLDAIAAQIILETWFTECL